MQDESELAQELWNPVTKYLWDVSLWNEIFSHLDNEYDLIIISMVNKQFKAQLMQNYFWINFIDNNYKYAEFDIYDSIQEFLNIWYKMDTFLEKNKNIDCERVLSNIDTINITYQRKITNFKFLSHSSNYSFFNELSLDDFSDITVQKEQHNKYCNIVDVCYDSDCFKDALLLYNKFLPEDHINKYVVLIKGDCTCFGKNDNWNFIIYNNYIWYVHETFNRENINITFFAINIITSKLYQIYTYDDHEYNDIWKQQGYWKFYQDFSRLILHKDTLGYC